MPLLSLLPWLAAAASPLQGNLPPPVAPGPPVAACATLEGQSGAIAVDHATMITPSPEWRLDGGGTYAAVPVRTPFCRVEGRIEGTIGFELWLPAQWSGRLLGAGVGGDAGIFNYRDMAIRVQQGFATVTTDSGHKISQSRWMRDAKARVDYEHRAVHLTAQAAKVLVARYYARPADRSYFLGCSGGGRQALKEMQNYPGDYDGVVAGAPGPNMPLQSVRMLWFALEQQRHPEAALSDADWSLYEQRAFAACDGLDGVADGIVENPRACRFRTVSLLCKQGQAQDCLTAPKLAMLDRIIAPMRDEQGRRMDGGLLAGVRTRPGPPSPLLRAMWADAAYDNPDWDAQTFRRTADLAAINRIMPELRTNRTAIAPFMQRGGKAIIYQGWQDPSTNAGPTIDYFSALAAAHGGVDRLAAAVRLFMVPGMYHCRGGPAADLFGGSGHVPVQPDPRHDIVWALINWVEAGKAPERLVAAKRQDGQPTFTRALCPFPQSAHFTGKGDSNDAASWQCRADPLLSRMLRR